MQKSTIIFIVIIAIFSGVYIFGLYHHGRTDTRHQREIDELNGIIADIRNDNTELIRRNTELEKTKRDQDSAIQELDEVFTADREAVVILQDVRNTIEGENSEIRKEVEGIREILQEVTGGDN
jgi:chromosome segregation ATPase